VVVVGVVVAVEVVVVGVDEVDVDLGVDSWIRYYD